MRRKIILVDQDGVLSDTEGGFRRQWKDNYPQIICPLPRFRKTSSLRGNFNKKFSPEIENILYAKGFAEKLTPVSGAIDAIKEMSQYHDVFICTTPLAKYQFNLSDKSKWVEQYLGEEWARRKIIFVRDKTLINGDILIDDSPEIKGLRNPSWEHIIFDQPYNVHIQGKRRIDWNNWKRILSELF
ncbi:MAG: 5'-3'-deoxyribonucleotidase [Nanoarchaeota archaeon]|nr:5'-3'-deoxyribonucleotidase [Nanoarchaeota archaeon]